MLISNDEETKNHLLKLAKNAKIKILLNNYLHEKLKYLKDYTKLTKETIQKCLNNKKSNSLSLLYNYHDKILKDNINFQQKSENLTSKFNSLLNICVNETPIGSPNLTKEKNDNFLLDFVKIKNNSIIKGLDHSIMQSKEKRIFREKQRDNLVDKERGNKEIEKANNDIQQMMLYELKKCNHFKEKTKSFNAKKEGLSNNIKLLKNYISNNKMFTSFNNEDLKKEKEENNKKVKKKNIVKSLFIPKSERFIHVNSLNKSFDEKNNSIEDKKIKNKIISDFQKLEDLMDISIEEIEIEEEIHGEEDTLYEYNKYPNKKISTNYLKKIKDKVPSLKLNMINYNLNAHHEVDIYSIERRKFLRKSLKNQLIEMKEKKEKAQARLNNLNKKLDKLEKLSQTIQENYNIMKSMTYLNTTANINSDLAHKSLNNKEKNKDKNDENKDDLDEFFNGIQEVEEEIYEEREIENDKSEDKETKDTKKDNDEEKEIKFNKKINLDLRFTFRPKINKNKFFNKSLKPSNIIKKFYEERPKSK